MLLEVFLRGERGRIPHGTDSNFERQVAYLLAHVTLSNVAAEQGIRVGRSREPYVI